MGNFSFSGSTPKKVLYNGVEVKKILFNNVEVWRKAIEAGSKSVIIDRVPQTKTLSFTVPDSVTKLKLTAKRINTKDILMSFTVTPGENVKFIFNSFSAGPGGYYLVQYSFNGSRNDILGDGQMIITVEWSEEINNS